jgi:hypothetical protein
MDDALAQRIPAAASSFEPKYPMRARRCPMMTKAYRALKHTRRLLVASILAGLALTAGACVIDGEYLYVDDGPGSSYADLEVRWTIHGAESATLCSNYDIKTWIVEIRGPESRDAVVDCRNHYWSSENDFLMLREGDYTVRVTALDANDRELGSLSSYRYLYDQGSVELLQMNFIATNLL